MSANYSGYKPTTGDTQYATKINNFIDAVETDMNTKQDTATLQARSILAKTTNYTIETDDYTILINANVADVTITLPAASTNTGRLLVFKRIDATAYRAIIGSAYELYVYGESVTLQSDGTNWIGVA